MRCKAVKNTVTLGILGGMKAIPEDWMKHIGDGIITVALAGGIITSRLPKTCAELTEHVVTLAPAVLKSLRVGSVTLHNGEDVIPEDYLESIKKNRWLRAPLENLIPNSMIFDGLFFKATVIYDGAPEIAPLEEKTFKILFQNRADVQSNTGASLPSNLNLRWLGTDGFTVKSRSSLTLPHWTTHTKHASVTLDVTVIAGEKVEPVNRLVLEVVNEGKAQVTYIPVVFLG